MHIRNHLKSNGDLYTWTWPYDLGAGYMGPKVKLTITKKDISPARAAELKASEERVRIADEKIRRHHKVEPAAGTALPANYRAEPDEPVDYK